MLMYSHELLVVDQVLLLCLQVREPDAHRRQPHGGRLPRAQEVIICKSAALSWHTGVAKSRVDAAPLRQANWRIIGDEFC